MKKHNKWPSEQLLADGIGFVDFCKDEFEDHYRETASGEWLPSTQPAQFTMEQLRLNSDHLKEMRCLRRDLLDRRPKQPGA